MSMEKKKKESQNPGPLRSKNKGPGWAGADVGCAVDSLFQAARLDGEALTAMLRITSEDADDY